MQLDLPQITSFLQVLEKKFISLQVVTTISIIPSMLEEASRKRSR